MKELTEDTYFYRQLKQKYPYSSKFFMSYENSDYYNPARTIFYDENMKELEYLDHGFC